MLIDDMLSMNNKFWGEIFFWEQWQVIFKSMFHIINSNRWKAEHQTFADSRKTTDTTYMKMAPLMFWKFPRHLLRYQLKVYLSRRPNPRCSHLNELLAICERLTGEWATIQLQPLQPLLWWETRKKIYFDDDSTYCRHQQNFRRPEKNHMKT